MQLWLQSTLLLSSPAPVRLNEAGNKHRTADWPLFKFQLSIHKRTLHVANHPVAPQFTHYPAFWGDFLELFLSPEIFKFHLCLRHLAEKIEPIRWETVGTSPPPPHQVTWLYFPFYWVEGIALLSLEILLNFLEFSSFPYIITLATKSSLLVY